MHSFLLCGGTVVRETRKELKMFRFLVKDFKFCFTNFHFWKVFFKVTYLVSTTFAYREIRGYNGRVNANTRNFYRMFTGFQGRLDMFHKDWKSRVVGEVILKVTCTIDLTARGRTEARLRGIDGYMVVCCSKHNFEGWKSGEKQFFVCNFLLVWDR